MIIVNVLLDTVNSNEYIENKIRNVFNTDLVNVTICKSKELELGTYYSRHVKELREKSKKYYAKNHKRKYCYSYNVISPEGKKINFDKFQEVVNFLGYSDAYIHQVIRSGKTIAGYKIEKVY